MQEKIENVLKKIPKDGFIKLTSVEPAGISSTQKAALIRKGNSFFNSGEIEKAKRIFLTTGYTDGLIRVGDWYMSQDTPLEAVRMYWLAPAPDKVAEWSEKASGAIRRWLGQD